MKYKQIPIPNSSKVIYWDESLPIKDNILANLKGVRDDENDIPAYINGKHSSERMAHARNIINTLEPHTGLYLPHDIEQLLETLPSHGKDGKPSLLYAIIQHAVRESTNQAIKTNKELSNNLDEENRHNKTLSDEKNKLRTDLKNKRLEKIDSDIALLDEKKATEDLEKESLSLDSDIKSLEKEMKTLGEKKTQLLQDRKAIPGDSATTVVKYFESKLKDIETSIQSIPTRHEELVLRRDDLVSKQLSNAQSNKKTIDSLHKSISEVLEKLKSRVLSPAVEKSHGPGFFGNEPNLVTESDLSVGSSVNQNEKESYDEWDIKDNLWFNLESKIKSYLNTGIHSPSRIKSAKSVLAKIRELRELKLEESEKDRKLLEFIRQQTISSHGLNGKASDLHQIYRNAEAFVRQRETHDKGKKQSELEKIQESNKELSASIKINKEEIEQVEIGTIENKTQLEELSKKGNDIQRRINFVKEKIIGLGELLKLKEEELKKEESVNDALRFARLSNDSKNREKVTQLRQDISIQKTTKNELEAQLPTLTQEVENLEKTLETLKKENNLKTNEIRHHYLLAKKLSRKVDPNNPMTGNAIKYSIESLVTSAERYVANLERNEKLEQSPPRKRAKTSTNPFDTPPVPVQPSQQQEGSDNETSEDTEDESNPLSPDKDKFKNNPFA